MRTAKINFISAYTRLNKYPYFFAFTATDIMFSHVGIGGKVTRPFRNSVGLIKPA
jgi:hypothetical protein